MQDPGLNHRLHQRSRRAGFMIGLTMALTLAVCVGSFTLIYAQLEPVVSDFVSDGSTEEPTSPSEVAEAPDTAASEPDENAAASEPTPEPTSAPEDEDVEEASEPTTEPTPEDDEFVPDYQLDSPGPVNLRPGPGVNTGEAIVAVPVEAPLMYLGESQPTEDPGGDGLDEGQEWMLFRTEDGEEGWIREIDVTEFTP